MQNVFREISGVNDAMLGMQEIRCKKCHKKLGMVEGNYEIKCPRCGEMNTKKESVENALLNQKTDERNDTESI